MKSLKFKHFLYRFLMPVCLLIGVPVEIYGQNTKHSPAGFTLTGTIFESSQKETVALPYASIYLPQSGQGTISDNDGKYKIENISAGKIQLVIRSLGLVTIDTTLTITKDTKIDFTLLQESFRLQEVTVTAQANKAGQATSSTISQLAMEHLQASSISDLMALVPGGVSQNPTLEHASQIQIRNASSASNDANMSGLGAAIIRNGAPVSNNANLQTMSPTVSGGSAGVGGAASPSGGVDLRSLSVSNIERIEVVRGIPSVEYGDLSSGAVIITSKAGRDPLKVNAGVNSAVYQVGASKGFDLQKNRGVLNVSTNYAYTQKNPIQSYLTYQRFNGELLYSKSLFNNRLRTNTSVDVIYGKDDRKRNPDDEKTQTSSKGSNFTTSFNTNGTLFFKDLWLKNIRYTASVSAANKSSYYEQLYTSATAPYSMTTTDGAILSNRPNTDLYTASGDKITNISPADKDMYAQLLPSEYLGRYDIDGKEIGLYAKIVSNFFKSFGKVDNRFLIGTDFKSDGNRGKGKTFDPTRPPLRSMNSADASYRPRSYKEIPFVNQFSLFAEENFTWNIGKRALKLQAGVRWDNVSAVKNAISPRFNMSFDVVPEHFTIRGGYGITAKAPTLLYLHPELAYFEYLNLNEIGLSKIPEEDQRIITTTRVFDTQNSKLEMAKNRKAEIGFDLKWNKTNLRVTAFTERMNNGYSIARTVDTFHSLEFNEYERAGVNAQGEPVFQLKADGANRVLASYHTPTNTRTIRSKGVEFDLNLGRIDAIRTAITLNGSWIKTESFNNDYLFFDGNSGLGGNNRTHVAMYEKGMQKQNYENLVTAVRLTHNIPKVGFVVTLTAQTIWKESNWNVFGNDSIPVKYIDKNDGKIYDFNPELKEEKEFKPLIRNKSERLYIKESFSPALSFNLNVTKEIGKNFRMSFFANNFFRSYPIQKSKRDLGTYIRRNQKFFFGMNLALTL